MLEVEEETVFDKVDGKTVVNYYPKVFGDGRGSFSEVLVGEELDGIKQVNRSKSCGMVLRGMHAQAGEWCQAKIVEAVNAVIYDVIVDMRPDSQSFGLFGVFKLDPIVQNKLYVPRGFLHAFAVPPTEGEAIFMYYCDNVFNKQSEICINPMSAIPKVVEQLKTSDSYEKYEDFVKMFEDPSKLILSDKDLAGKDYETFAKQVKEEWQCSGKSSRKVWYR